MSEPASHNDLPAAIDRERDRPHPLQIELYRRATPTHKLAAVARLNATAFKLKESDLLARHSALSEEQRRKLIRRWWLTSRD